MAAPLASRVSVGSVGDDVYEVCNYLDAIKYAREQIKSARGLPISMRLLNEAHRQLTGLLAHFEKYLHKENGLPSAPSRNRPANATKRRKEAR
jgi:hypothetical protein